MKMRAWAMGWLLLGSSAGMAGAAEWFVATNGSDAANGVSWATAKQTIQAGIDAATEGDMVWVSNGVYATGGGRAVVGTRANRVSIDRSITVRSVNGPAETLIVGGEMRCAYVTNGAVLSGFTLTNGTTAGGMCGLSETDTIDHRGGGAYCETNATLTNCVLTGNWACWSGGGANGGILYNCTLTNNGAGLWGAGACESILHDCALLANHCENNGGAILHCEAFGCTLIGNRASAGGGSDRSTLEHCLLADNYGGSIAGGALSSTLSWCRVTGNLSRMEGGGANLCTLYNCLLDGNRAETIWEGDEPSGGGAKDSTLVNCTVVSNTGFWGGGVRGGTMINCIVYGNTATNDPNWKDGSFTNCCTTPLPAGTSNVTNDPRFVDAAAGDYRLAAGSPCIEAGENAFAIGLRDLDGNPRIVNAMVDMGAYEYQDGTHLVIAPLATNLDSGASSGHEIEVLASVSWTAATNVSWLSVTSGGSGTTNGMVHFSAATNGITGARTGAVIVAGGGLSRTCTVVQAAFVPALAVSPTSTNVGCAAAGGLALEVMANISWTASTNVPWLAISSSDSGTTNGTVVFDVATNAGAARTGAVIVAGGGLSRTCTVVQAAFVPALEIFPASTNAVSGGAGGLAIGVTANVAWTAATNAPWLAISSGDSGTTNGTVLFDVAANAGAARTGAVIVAGGGLARTCTVVQAAFVPALAVSPASVNAGSGGASGLALGVTANISWTAATNVPWLAISSGDSGTTNGTVLFDVAANAGAARTGAVIVAGGGLARTCTVVQVKSPALAVNWYVATNGNNAAAGTNWATAKQTIQAAVDAAEAGDVVWVSNGTYATGGRAVYGGMTNRVAIGKPVTVQSVYGPDETILLGGVATRCAYVGTNAVLSGFTLTNGATRNVEFADHARERSGGGAWCESSGVLSNCVLSGNSAGSYGGGAYGGVLRNCALKGNLASWGGGAHGAALWSCEVSGNSVTIGGSGGGVDSCTANLCVLSGNTADVSGGGGAFESTLNNCIVSDNRALIGGGTYAGSANNCVIIGNWAGSGFPDDGTGGGGSAGGTLINCIVYGNGATSGSNYLSSAFQHSCTAPHPGGTGNIASDPRFVDAAARNYRLIAGSPCINAGDNAAAAGAVDLDGSPRIVFGTVDMGAYEFLYQHVAPGGSDGASGFSWATAKQTIQAAVDATTNGCIVLVTNGVYATGGRTVGSWELTNRVAIDRPIIVQSVNGPEVTTIQGAGPMGDAAVRCAYVGSNAVLSGFTLTNGATKVYSLGNELDASGAGLWCEPSAIIQRCLIVNNQASLGAGGCLYGKLHDCLFVGNTAGSWGGGAYESVLYNCTLTGNGAYDGGGVFRATALNSIIWGNTATNGENYFQGSISNSCTTPDPGGTGNVASDPQFVDAAAGDYRLQATSPCLDAGEDGAVSWAEDLDGNQRIVYGAVDMGAYELQLTGEGTWFGAIVNGLTGDLDCVAGDGVPNLLKYATGGSPRISDDKMLVDWAWNGWLPALTFNRNPNATDVRFVVECAEAISNGAAWRGVATNVNGSWGGATNVSESGAGNPVACTVTDPVALGTNRFLRLRVSRP